MPGNVSRVQSPKIDMMMKANEQKQKENTITFSTRTEQDFGLREGQSSSTALAMANLSVVMVGCERLSVLIVW